MPLPGALPAVLWGAAEFLLSYSLVPMNFDVVLSCGTDDWDVSISWHTARADSVPVGYIPFLISCVLFMPHALPCHTLKGNVVRFGIRSIIRIRARSHLRAINSSSSSMKPVWDVLSPFIEDDSQYIRINGSERFCDLLGRVDSRSFRFHNK